MPRRRLGRKAGDGLPRVTELCPRVRAAERRQGLGRAGESPDKAGNLNFKGVSVDSVLGEGRRPGRHCLLLGSRHGPAPAESCAAPHAHTEGSLSFHDA